ncbi:MAG: hypothetical protein LBK95_06005 [Bifidobacteriaceae bacterium]|nr:hypothetical protein [Bifidobacteriaceae bacterium]
MTITEQAPRLTAQDRCDRCGARSYIRATLMSGELLFCGHHGRESMDALRSQAIQIDDFTDELVGVTAQPER